MFLGYLRTCSWVMLHCKDDSARRWNRSRRFWRRNQGLIKAPDSQILTPASEILASVPISLRPGASIPDFMQTRAPGLPSQRDFSRCAPLMRRLGISNLSCRPKLRHQGGGAWSSARLLLMMNLRFVSPQLPQVSCWRSSARAL